MSGKNKQPAVELTDKKVRVIRNPKVTRTLSDLQTIRKGFVCE